jgi:acetylornithine deacetylase/succinyl-diaminopimelate desuccinylase-like protein
VAKNGIAHPAVIDLVTTKDGQCFLDIIQVDRMSDDDLFALQDKINSYLSFALDGQLAKMYPELASAPVTIRLNLGSDPSETQQRFFSAIRGLCHENRMDFEVAIPEYLLELERRFPTVPISKPWWRFW